jgi:hypothetical protein
LSCAAVSAAHTGAANTADATAMTIACFIAMISGATSIQFG